MSIGSAVSRQSAGLAPYLYIAPAMAFFALFFVFPFVYSVFVGFHTWNLMTGVTEYIGVLNYRRLFADPVFFRALGNTFNYVAVQTPLSIVLGLIYALLIETVSRKRKPLYRLIFFIPVVISVSAASLSFLTIFNTVHGPLNSFLAFIGLAGPNWLNSSSTAMWAIIMIGVWQSFGYNVILYMSGLKQIDRQLYEAAAIDGTNVLQRFLHITLPMLSPVSFFVFVMTTLFSFQVFATVQILTGGGPSNATNVWVYYVWREAFRFFDTGTASAAATVLFVTVLAVTMVFAGLMQRRVFYR